MAYMTSDGQGPYPNKAGEFCGNYHPERSSWRTLEEQVRELKWLCQMRFGWPHSCPAGTVEEMEANGYVGLYLKKDQLLKPGDIEVDTPEELREPSVCERLGEETWRGELNMRNTDSGCLWQLICLVIAIAVAGFTLDYSLNIYFGKDIPWYGDCLAGIFASPVTVPAAVIGFILECCGVSVPFFHV